MSNVDEENIGEILQDHSITSVTWKIPACSLLPQDVDSCIESPSFTFLDADFYLRLYSNGESLYDNQGYIALYLVKKNSSTYIHTIEYTIGIRKTDGKLYKVLRNVENFEGNEDYWGFSKFVKRQQLLSKKMKIAPYDTLSIFCELQAKQMDSTKANASNNAYSNNATQTTPREDQDECALDTGFTEEIEDKNARKAISPNLAGWDSFFQNMKNLFKEECLCDITIQLEDEKLRAHKIILAAHSPVFSGMFTHEMSEESTGIIEIRDFESNVFKEFLQYLYTGSREALSLSNICKLYGLAHKYDVKHLQKECVSIMIGGLAVDTFCDIISLAVKYEESELTKEATNFFMENVKSILVSTKWQNFMPQNSTIANELFLKTIEK